MSTAANALLLLTSFGNDRNYQLSTRQVQFVLNSSTLFCVQNGVRFCFRLHHIANSTSSATIFELWVKARPRTNCTVRQCAIVDSENENARCPLLTVLAHRSMPAPTVASTAAAMRQWHIYAINICTLYTLIFMCINRLCKEILKIVFSLVNVRWQINQQQTETKWMV